MRRRRAEKLLERARRPDGQQGWRYDQLRRILEEYGFKITNPRSSGSHRFFKHPQSGVRVGIPDQGSGTVLPVYVREVVKQIDAAREGDDASD